MARTSAPRLNALTSLRFFAAAGIVLVHCGGHFGLPANFINGERVPLFLGVSFFFVLSGFILTYVYPSLETRPARFRFLWARIARVWPCQVFTFGVAILIAHSFGVPYSYFWTGRQTGPTLATLSLVHSWIPLKAYYLNANGPSWSVSTEFGFYLLFPILIRRFDRTWHVKLATCWLLALGLLAACKFGPIPYDRARGVCADNLLYHNPLARVFEFCLGMTTATLFKTLSPKFRLGRLGGTALELAALAFLAANAYFWSDLATWIMAKTDTPWTLRVWFSHQTTCLSFATLIFVAALGLGRITQILSWKGFVFLGEISYAAYLLHFPLMGFIDGHVWAAYPNAPAGSIFVGYLVAVLAASAATWVVVERPSRTFLVGLWPKPSSIPSPHLIPASRASTSRGVTTTAHDGR